MLGRMVEKIYTKAEDMCDKPVPVVREYKPAQDGHLVYPSVLSIHEALYSNARRLLEKIHQIIPRGGR